MTSFFQITAYNAQDLYFWGTEQDAARYVDWLNRDRDINHYSASAIPQADWAEYEGRDDVLSSEDAYWDEFMSDDV